MKSKKTRIAVTLAGIAVLAVTTLPYLVNLDRLRPQLESTLQSHLGREVHIGYLEFSLLAGGARANSFSIADDPAFGSRPFLQAKSIEVGVSWINLIFSHSLHLTKLKIEQPELVLAKSSSGKWNFSSLGASSTPDAFNANFAAQDSSLSFFLLDRLSITNATLMLPGAPGSSQSHVLKNVNIGLQNASFDGTMSFVVSTHSDRGKIELRGEAGPINRDLPERTPFHATMKGANANLAQIASLNSSSGLSGILGWNASVTSDGRALHSEGTAHAEKLRLTGSGPGSRQPISLRYVTDYSLAQRTGVLDQCEISVRNSKARLGGSYQVRGESLVTRLRLTGSQLALDDVEGVLPALGIQLPGGSKLHGGAVNASLALTGPVDRLVTTGTVQLANASLLGFDLGSKLSSIPALTGMPSAQDLAIVSLSSGLRIGPQGIHISNFDSKIAGIGGLSGDGDIDSANHLQFNMTAHLASGGALRWGLNNFGWKNVPDDVSFRIIGTTSLPVFVPDLSGLARNCFGRAFHTGHGQPRGGEGRGPEQKSFFPFPSKAKDASPVPSHAQDASPAPADHKHGFFHSLFHHGKQKNQKDRTELAAKR